MATRGQLGRIGEGIATRHLEADGFTVVARNWRCARGGVRGELDVVAWDRSVLVICEVKTRRSASTGGPLAAVTPAKQAQVRRLAACFLAATGVSSDEVRFDVVAVSWPEGGGRPRVEHLRGAW